MNEPFDLPRWQLHRFEKGTRYYITYLTQRLFGEWQVERRSGGKRRRSSRSLVMPAASYAEAVDLLAAVIMRRRQRGYDAVDAQRAA